MFVKSTKIPLHGNCYPGRCKIYLPHFQQIFFLIFLKKKLASVGMGEHGSMYSDCTVSSFTPMKIKINYLRGGYISAGFIRALTAIYFYQCRMWIVWGARISSPDKDTLIGTSAAELRAGAGSAGEAEFLFAHPEPQSAISAPAPGLRSPTNIFCFNFNILYMFTAYGNCLSLYKVCPTVLVSHKEKVLKYNLENSAMRHTFSKDKNECNYTVL